MLLWSAIHLLQATGNVGDHLHCSRGLNLTWCMDVCRDGPEPRDSCGETIPASERVNSEAKCYPVDEALDVRKGQEPFLYTTT
jgi:hypothetical protein